MLAEQPPKIYGIHAHFIGDILSRERVIVKARVNPILNTHRELIKSFSAAVILYGDDSDKQANFTIIFVTHDQSEAMAISDRMMVCDMGKIMQIDTPENLYNKPANRFVHSFLGESTFLNVVIRDGRIYAEGDMEQPLDLPAPPNADPQMIMATRPNAIALTGDKGYQTHIEKRIFLTDRTEYLVPVGSQMLKIQTPHRVAFSQGERCRVDFLEPMWYPAEDKAAEEERNRRQLV